MKEKEEKEKENKERTNQRKKKIRIKRKRIEREKRMKENEKQTCNIHELDQTLSLMLAADMHLVYFHEFACMHARARN